MTMISLTAQKYEWVFESFIQGTVFKFGTLIVDETKDLKSGAVMIHNPFTETMSQQKNSI